MPNFSHPDFTKFVDGAAIIKTAAARKYLTGVAHVAVATSEKLASVSDEQASSIEQRGIPAVAGIALCREKIASGEVDKAAALGNVESLKTAMRNDFLSLCAIPASTDK